MELSTALNIRSQEQGLFIALTILEVIIFKINI